MNIRTTFLAALALVSLAGAQTWKLDSTHTSIGFSVKHLAVSTVRGTLDQYEGTLSGDPKKPTTMKIDMTIQAASIDTRNDKRDEHVRGSDFLDVVKFPTIVFKGDKVVLDGKQLAVVGTLTLHGVSKRVVIPFTLNGPVVDPWKNNRIGFEGSFKIKRQDYGIESYPGAVGDEITIDISTEYTEAK